jgi:hypothetical protein
MAGGNLLRLILDRMERAGPPLSPLSTFYLYSAHYPTILSVFAALDSNPGSWQVEDETAGGQEQEIPVRVPDYAAALILEMYSDAVDETVLKSVRVLYKPGYRESAAYVIRIGKGCASSGPYCDLSTVSSSFLADFSQAQWCRVCNNTGADICLAASLASSTGPPATSDNASLGGLGAVPALFVGMACGVVLALAAVPLARKCRGARRREVALEDGRAVVEAMGEEEDTGEGTAAGSSAAAADGAALQPVSA